MRQMSLVVFAPGWRAKGRGEGEGEVEGDQVTNVRKMISRHSHL
jgi:hypothetical protein